MAKKKMNPESGIYGFRVNGKAVRKKVPALTESEAVEKYKRQFPADNEKNIRAKKIKDMPIGMDAEQYAKKLEEVEQQAEEAIEKHLT
jgi:hypothetical protein